MEAVEGGKYSLSPLSSCRSPRAHVSAGVMSSDQRSEKSTRGSEQTRHTISEAYSHALYCNGLCGGLCNGADGRRVQPEHAPFCLGNCGGKCLTFQQRGAVSDQRVTWHQPSEDVRHYSHNDEELDDWSTNIAEALGRLRGRHHAKTRYHATVPVPQQAAQPETQEFGDWQSTPIRANATEYHEERDQRLVVDPEAPVFERIQPSSNEKLPLREDRTGVVCQHADNRPIPTVPVGPPVSIVTCDASSDGHEVERKIKRFGETIPARGIRQTSSSRDVVSASPESMSPRLVLSRSTADRSSAPYRPQKSSVKGGDLNSSISSLRDTLSALHERAIAARSAAQSSEPSAKNSSEQQKANCSADNHLMLPDFNRLFTDQTSNPPHSSGSAPRSDVINATKNQGAEECSSPCSEHNSSTESHEAYNAHNTKSDVDLEDSLSDESGSAHVQDSEEFFSPTLAPFESPKVNGSNARDRRKSQIKTQHKRARDNEARKEKRKQETEELFEKSHPPEERHSSPPVLNKKPWPLKTLNQMSTKKWKCAKHMKEFTRWCYEPMCNDLLCIDCAAIDHSGHATLKIPKHDEFRRRLDQEALVDTERQLLNASTNIRKSYEVRMRGGRLENNSQNQRDAVYGYNSEGALVPDVPPADELNVALRSLEVSTDNIFEGVSQKLEYLTGKLQATKSGWSVVRRRVPVDATKNQPLPPLYGRGMTPICRENKYLSERVSLMLH
ncbi:hypothetical protein DIPPA_70030 [Diplonema papillatum]|nr:hypothetical protein DIPPA_70030 [Diplonema papillatum]